MSKLVQLKEGLRIVRRARSFKGFRQYQGTAEEICRHILEECYDREKKYFRVSAGHFCEFYVRDFAFCCEALVQLGYREEVRSTLNYALNIFRKHGRIEGSISPHGVPFTFPSSGPDTLSLFIYSFTHTGNEKLIAENKWFFQKEIDRFVKEFVDRKTLVPKKSKSFTSIRDQAKRKGACYDAVMIALLAKEAPRAGLHFPYTEEQVVEALLQHYWNGTYFFQDLATQPIVIGDANVFPFWAGVVKDKEILENAFTSIQAAGLDAPFPLRYVSTLDKPNEKVRFDLAASFSPDYETDSIWMHMGLCYLKVLFSHNKELFKKHLKKYEDLIVEHKNFLEIYNAKGDPYKTTFYVSDESMSWCANFLTLKKMK